MKKLILILMFSLSLVAGNLELKSGFVGAHTEMLMDSTIDPLNTHLKADLSMSGDDILSLKGKLWLKMELFSSDESERDEHMDEAVNVDSFPLATYTVSSLTKKETKDNYVIHGTLNFHGQEKAFMLDAEIKDSGNGIAISATSSFLVSDYGVEMPCMMFMCVRDKVDIFAKAVLLRK